MSRQQWCYTHVCPARADAALRVYLCARGCAGAALPTATKTSDKVLHPCNAEHSQVAGMAQKYSSATRVPCMERLRPSNPNMCPRLCRLS